LFSLAKQQVASTPQHNFRRTSYIHTI